MSKMFTINSHRDRTINKHMTIIIHTHKYIAINRLELIVTLCFIFFYLLVQIVNVHFRTYTLMSY